MPGKSTARTAEQITYEELVEMLEKLGFVERASNGDHRVFEHEREREWVFVFPGGKRFQKPVDGADWISVRVHLDYWGLLEATDTEELLRKLRA